MRFYGTITKIDGERRMVWGYASTETEDSQGEIVKRAALEAALADYMRFANVREMHLPSAVGVATEASLDDKGLYLGARIVDDDAWEKVVEGVYKGFSIGGKVTARDATDRKIITGLSLTEISIVDRPANPEAVFDCWKADMAEVDPAPEGRARAPNGEFVRLVQRAHDHLCRAGARCHDFAGTDDGEAAMPDAAKADLGELAKMLSGDIVSRLDALAKRVEDIAQTPLPPMTVSRSSASLSKREDSGGFGPSLDDVVAALACMSDEERTLTLIKAAHANPIRVMTGR